MKLDLSEEQIQVLDSISIDPDSLILIKGKQLHDYMVYNHAYTDGDVLIFFDDYKGGGDKDQKKFLYYMGAEKEAELTLKYEGITVYENISTGRLTKYTSNKQEDKG